MKYEAMERLKIVLERLKEYQPERIILFGSYARGEADEYSDLDFVVIKKTGKRFLERLIEVAKLIDNDLGNVDVFVYTPEEFERMIEWENPFIERVLKEGRVLYEKSWAPPMSPQAPKGLSKEEANRWLEQAKHDFESAKRMYAQKDYSDACFFSEQAGQKALKAYLYFKGERYVWEHSIFKLAVRCKNYKSEFEQIIDCGKILDRYYLTTRYPDAIAPPAIPYESFTEKDAAEAISYAQKILEMVKNRLTVF